MKPRIYKNLNISVIKNSSLSSFINNDEITLFHHIHKTAGTSLETILSKWYILHRDYNLNKTNSLNNYRNCHCITGHYGYHNIHLDELYPDVWDSKYNHKVFTFLRDPLSRSVSHFYHWKKAEFEGYQDLSLEDYLMGDAKKSYINDVSSNWMAFVLNVGDDNYKSTLEKYYFIGIFENLQESVNLLAHRLKKPNHRLPKKRMGIYKKSYNISEEVINTFKKRNELDYKIYDYGLKRFKNENQSNLNID